MTGPHGQRRLDAAGAGGGTTLARMLETMDCPLRVTLTVRSTEPLTDPATRVVFGPESERSVARELLSDQA